LQEHAGGDAVGYAGRADRTEVDRVERRELLEAVGVHHPLVLQVVLAAERQLHEVERHAAAARRRLECRHPRRNHLAADSIPRDYCHTMCRCHVVIP